MARVFVVHPDRLFRESLAAAVGGEADLEVVGCAAGVDRVRLVPGAPPPEVLVLDFGLPERTGLAAARAVHATLPEIRILMIGCSELERDVLACAEAGAAGYAVAGTSLEELLRALRAVARGGAICSQEVAGLLFRRIAHYTLHRPQHGAAPVRLTPRELEILRLLNDGLCNKELAARLRIELQTVKNHIHNILDKLGVGRREEAVRFARRRGLLGPVVQIARPAAPRDAAREAGAGY